MKKTLSILSMMLLGCALYAGPITPEKALQVARRVFEAAPATKATDPSALQIVWDGEFEPATKSAQDPAFYVVSRPGGGFVMVAGNDNVQPVLAFSFENQFKVEGMPENVRWWMEELKGYARSAVRPTPEIEQEWSVYADTKAVIPDDEIEPLSEFKESRTNLWDQRGPANLFTPTITGQASQSVCGCVPLALSEIMAWFGTKNRNSFTGTVESYSYKAYDPTTKEYSIDWTIEEHTLCETHDWEKLASLATAEQFYGAPEALAEDLGHLVYDVGTLLQVEYNANGTNGVLIYLNRLTTMMGYNQAALPKMRENYTSSEWISMLVTEITDHPVYYEGQDTGNLGGHAFVADGYATTKQNGKQVIHFNFGWGGSCNGYYDCLNDIGTANGYNFFSHNSALLGFVPDPTGTTAAIQKLGYFIDERGGGLTLQPNSSTLHNNIYLSVTNLRNIGSTQFNGTISMNVVNKEGVPTVAWGSMQYYTISNFNVSSWYNPFSWEVTRKTPVLGDKYALFYQVSGTSDYKPVEGGTSGQILTEVPLFPAAAIKRKASYTKDDFFVFELTNHDYRYGNACWSVTTPGGETTNYSQSDYRVQLTEVGDYKISCTTPGQETVVTYVTVTAAP